MSKLLLLCILIPSFALAKEARRPSSGNSAWLLCKEKKHADPHDNFVPVLMLYNHRVGEDWKTEIYVNYGQYLMTGSVSEDDKFSGPVELKSVTDAKASFTGTVTTNYKKPAVTLTGTSDITGESKSYKFTLPCEDMN